MNIKILIIPLCLLALAGCKQDSAAKERMHAATLAAEVKKHKDKLEAQIIMAKQNAPLQKFMIFTALAALLVWACLYYRARLASEKLVQEYRIAEEKARQITLREKNKLALEHIFNPEIFKQLTSDERKTIFEGIGNEHPSLENLESKGSVQSPDQEKSTFRKKAENINEKVVEGVVEAFDDHVKKITKKTINKYHSKDAT